MRWGLSVQISLSFDHGGPNSDWDLGFSWETDAFLLWKPGEYQCTTALGCVYAPWFTSLSLELLIAAQSLKLYNLVSYLLEQDTVRCPSFSTETHSYLKHHDLTLSNHCALSRGWSLSVFQSFCRIYLPHSQRVINCLLVFRLFVQIIASHILLEYISQNQHANFEKVAKELSAYLSYLNDDQNLNITLWINLFKTSYTIFHIRLI